MSRSSPIRLLMIDDQPFVCEVVKRMTAPCPEIQFECLNHADGLLEKARAFKPTVILQDLVMPKVDGLDLLKDFKEDPWLKTVPIIVLSSKEDPRIKQRAFQLGADDYMVKLPDALEVLARVRHHSHSYTRLLERDRAEAELQGELNDAATYVQKLLPKPLDCPPLSLDWTFIASSTLAGDMFSYRFIDPDHFVIYLLDVCGHGVGAALHSVSVSHELRSATLSKLDFKCPSKTLNALNETFQMSDYDNRYFTIFYGVYQLSTRIFSYASGGHPPALLIEENGTAEELSSGGPVVGAVATHLYKKTNITIPPRACLYIFSDGVYEIPKAGNLEDMFHYQAFKKELLKNPRKKDKLNSMLRWARNFQQAEHFEDDFSLIKCLFK